MQSQQEKKSKAIRCRGRKTVKTCLKPPVSCAWSEQKQKCDFPEKPKPAPKPTPTPKPEPEPENKRAPSVRCAARRSIKTCTKNTQDCIWQNDKCMKRSQAPIVDPAIIAEDLAKVDIQVPPQQVTKLSTPERAAKALEKLQRVRAYYAAPMNDRIGYARRVQRILAQHQQNTCATMTAPASTSTAKASFRHKASNSQSSFIKVQRIGTASVYGETHLVKNTQISLKPLYVAAKVAPINTPGLKTELSTYYEATRLVTKNISPHFPVVYGHSICKSCIYENPKIKAARAPKKCLYIFNELAAGDLKSWIIDQFNNRSWASPEAYRSLVIQILLGLYTLHWHLRKTHDDLHWGNLLYHDTSSTEGGYWHYQLGTQDIYVKNTGQLWVLWDFGMMQTGYYDPLDAKRILHFPRWSEDLFHIKIPSYIHSISKLYNDNAAFVSRESDIESIRAFADNKTVWWNKKPTDGPILNLGRPFKVSV